VRIGLASDSFGNVDALGRALDAFERAKVDRIFFLGGRWGDVDAAIARRNAGASTGPVETDLDFLAAVQGALARASRAGEAPAPKLVRVASRACPEYGAGVPVKHVDLVEGKLCCLVHDKADLTRDDIANATLVFHGNSAAAAVVQFGPRVFVTPGRLRAPGPDDGPASFAVAEIGAHEVVLTVHGADGAPGGQQRAVLGAQGKLSVR
jgi:predicted phosphodiesterase